MVHPTLERLLQARLMVGGFDDEAWPTDPVTDFVCSGASCLQDGVKVVAGWVAGWVVISLLISLCYSPPSVCVLP